MSVGLRCNFPKAPLHRSTVVVGPALISDLSPGVAGFLFFYLFEPQWVFPIALMVGVLVVLQLLDIVFFFFNRKDRGESSGWTCALPQRLLFPWPRPAHFLEILTNHFCAIMIKSVEESLKRVGTPSSSTLHNLSPASTELPQIH